MSWLSRHSTAIQTASAGVTALVATAALIGVKLQLDQADTVQREQSARDAFRAHLALAAEHPAFAAPPDGCTLLASDRGGAYVAFVDHLLYSAEQMLELQEGWEASFLDQLAPHRQYLCSADAPQGDTAALAGLLAAFRQSECQGAQSCPAPSP